MGLGSGRGSLADKFHACVQAGFLVGGGVSNDTHLTSLSEFSNEVIGAVGDMGVEFSLPCVVPVPIQHLYPWMPVPQVENPRSEDDDWNFNPAAEVDPVFVSFSRALQVPGIQHIVHNAAQDMLDASPGMKPYVADLSTLVKLCIRKFTRRRLLAMCYDSDFGRVMARDILFRCEVHTKRWRTLAFSVADVMKAKVALQWGWDKDSYVDKEKKAPSSVETMDNAVSSDAFWFCMEALDSLFMVVTEMTSWSRGCPCHSGFIIGSTPPHVKRRWLECPLRGLRLPELCAGDLLAHARDVMKLQAVSLAMGAPDSLDDQDRDKLIWEYHRAQAHLLATLSLKLGPLQHGHFQLAAEKNKKKT